MFSGLGGGNTVTIDRATYNETITKLRTLAKQAPAGGWAPLPPESGPVQLPRTLYEQTLATVQRLGTQRTLAQLREQVDAIYAQDAVERGVKFLVNNYPRQAGGRFGFGPGPGAKAGAGGTGGTGGAKGKAAGGASHAGAGGRTKMERAPVTIHDDPSGAGRERLHALFGRDLSNEEIGGLVGALPGDHVEIGASLLGGGFRHTDAVDLTLHGHGWDPNKKDDDSEEEFSGAYWARRTLSRDPEGKLVMENGGNYQKETGGGTGTRILARQTESLSRMGVDRIETNAVGSKGDDRYNGYYTWARLGYNAPFSWRDEAPFDEHSGAFKAFRAGLPKSVLHARSIQGVMRTPAGRDWWRENGSGFSGTFSLRRGSVSMRVLRAYVKHRGIKLSEKQPAEEIAWTAADEDAANAAWAEVDRWLSQQEARGRDPLGDELKAIGKQEGKED